MVELDVIVRPKHISRTTYGQKGSKQNVQTMALVFKKLLTNYSFYLLSQFSPFLDRGILLSRATWSNIQPIRL